MKIKKVIVSTLALGMVLSTIPSLTVPVHAISVNQQDEAVDITQPQATSGLILEKNAVQINTGEILDLSGDPNAETIKNLTQGTIVVQFTSTSTEGFQSLFSASNGQIGNENRYFHIYVTPSGVLGMELRNTDGIFKYTFSRPAVLRNLYKGNAASNTVALKADKTNKEYKLFANGQLIETLKMDDFKFVSDITGVDRISVGGTIRGGAVKYPFGGTIENIKVYDTVLSDSELMNDTSATVYGTTIFNSQDATKSNYFRIPALITLGNGVLASAADSRFGGTHDSKSNIDIAFSKSVDGGVTWSSPVMPLYFDDYQDERVEWPRDAAGRDKQISGSASFIDAAIVEDAQIGRIYLFADAMPAGVGSPNAVVGSGYKTIDGVKYLKLRSMNDGANVYNYSVRDEGVIYNDVQNQPTDYIMNDDFEIIQNNVPLKVKQYGVRFEGYNLIEEKTSNDVNMNVFYKDSIFKVMPTTYLAMTYSDDEGATWSSMKLLNKELKSDSEKLFITGPGKGIQLQNGQNKGRIVVPVYTITNAGYGVIYSDDHGETWIYSKGTDDGTAATAEAQIVEMPDGSLKAFERTGKGKIAMSTSLDSGETWTGRVFVPGMTATSYGTQISAINYSKLVDGKPAIILAAPNSTSGRKDGRIRIGLINDTGKAGADKYEIEWKYNYAIDGAEIGFSYSCLTELPNNNIGILYEKYDSWSRNELHLKDILIYDEYSIDDLTGSSTN